MFSKRHTRQRLVVVGLTLVSLAVGALFLRAEIFRSEEHTSELQSQ